MEKSFSQILILSQPYFKEVRKRLFRSGIFFLIIFSFAFFFSEKIIKHFLFFLKIEDVQIITTSPFQFFNLAINVAFSVAIIVTFPFLIYNIISFLSPALTKKERKYLIKVVSGSILFFVIGFLFGFNILNYILNILAEYNIKAGIVNLWDVGLFSTQVFLTATLMGLIFQFPIILTVLIKYKVVKLESLRRKRRWAILIAFLVSSLLPPTDGVSLILMALPLILMFEVTLFYNRKRYK